MPGNRGYKYFGAARDLPGVRELFESDAPKEASTKIDKKVCRFILNLSLPGEENQS